MHMHTHTQTQNMTKAKMFYAEGTKIWAMTFRDHQEKENCQWLSDWHTRDHSRFSSRLSKLKTITYIQKILDGTGQNKLKIGPLYTNRGSASELITRS